MQRDHELARKRVLAAGIILIVLALFAVIAIKFYLPILKMADNPEEFRLYLEERGVGGIVLFTVIMALQVIIAVIPAGPLEVAAGYCFGSFIGTLICDIGMTVGSVTVFALVRRFGMAFIELFFSKEKIKSLKILKSTGQSRLVLFLIFLIPGTPKDIIGYGVGLTDLKLLPWIFITLIGRIPSILLSAMSGDALMEGDYTVFIIIIVALVLSAGIGTFVYRRWFRKQ
ncbi:MAG: VTT domain-containing protein [Lachnospiraceae bacterium]|nr:VTT domain-containing protein [Lachnospiraceae bacterium]